MAGGNGEKTEKPTGKRVKDEREKGNIARSRDLVGAASLVAATIGLAWFGVQMMSVITTRLSSALSTLAEHAHEPLGATSIAGMLWSDAGLLVKISGPPAFIAATMAIFASVAQTGWAYSPKVLELNWGRVSPANGFSKLKPGQAAPELLKSLFGMTVVGWVGYLLIREFYVQAPALMGMMPAESARLAWDRLWSLLWRTSLALVALALADYGLQRWRWFTKIKMTRQEVRDESKLNDGSPEMKARVRRIQRDMARNRMLKAVETATVVVTNPTHYAVALEYRRGEMSAPKVVAKGQDHMAARIREIARKHNVPIVENVTLARALHKHADVGDTIPADLFGAVAEVLAYLVRLKQLLL